MAKNKFPRKQVKEIFEKYIRYKNKNEYVKKHIFEVGVLNKKAFESIPQISERNVYISTLALMHIYERRERVLENIILPLFNSLLASPEGVYVNKGGKNRRGQIILVRNSEDHNLAAILEIVKVRNSLACQVITIFICDAAYLKNLKCLWNGGTATPSSQCNNS